MRKITGEAFMNNILKIDHFLPSLITKCALAIYGKREYLWMMTAIFYDWFDRTFVPAVRKHLRQRGLDKKAVLLLDNCRTHPPADMLRSADGKITVMYMSPNMTSIIDQWIISAFNFHDTRSTTLIGPSMKLMSSRP